MIQAKKGEGMGFWSVVSIGIGGMIGAGIFSILGVAARVSGKLTFRKLFTFGRGMT